MKSDVSFELLVEVARILKGEDAVKLVKALKKLGKATEDKLSRLTKIDLNNVRKILYLLHSHSLTSVDRVRDEMTGWFTFYWRLKLDAVEGFILSRKRKVLEKLLRRLAYEKDYQFYSCSSADCKYRISFGEAMEYFFHCPKCGSSLKFFDNTSFIEELKKRTRILREELGT
jgi:transcription initiation factor TFIIE subunit alpha